MKIQVPYGVTTLDIGTMRIYSMKLRFNGSSWSFIKPEIDKCAEDRIHLFVRQRDGYHTIMLQTESFKTFERIRQAINRGQIAKEEEILKLWRENSVRPHSKYVFKTPEDRNTQVMNQLDNLI